MIGDFKIPQQVAMTLASICCQISHVTLMSLVIGLGSADTLVLRICMYSEQFQRKKPQSEKISYNLDPAFWFL